MVLFFWFYAEQYSFKKPGNLLDRHSRRNKQDENIK